MDSTALHPLQSSWDAGLSVDSLDSVILLCRHPILSRPGRQSGVDCLAHTVHQYSSGRGVVPSHSTPVQQQYRATGGPSGLTFHRPLQQCWCPQRGSPALSSSPATSPPTPQDTSPARWALLTIRPGSNQHFTKTPAKTFYMTLTSSSQPTPKQL